MKTSPNFRGHHLPRLMIGLLAAGTLVRCECEADEFFPGATLTPDMILRFGDVPVSSEKTLIIQVRSNGSAAYIANRDSFTTFNADQASLASPTSQKWTVEPDPKLLTGLTPGKTATISVSYRPCPAAWDGNTLKASFNFDQCPTNADSIDLNFVDNGRAGSQRISLSGQPVAPPNITIWCPVTTACGDNMPMMRECNGASFGTVNAGDPPCDLVFEVRNTSEAGRPSGELSIDRFEILMKDINGGPIMQGEEIGFEVLDEAGLPMVVDSATPFLVPVDPIAMEGKKRFKLRFKGTRTGFWRGEARDMTGLRLYNSDPEKRIATAPLTATGSAPNLQVNPDFIDFGPVAQNFTKTSTVRVSNSGDANLRIDELKIESNNPELVIRTSRGVLTNINLAQAEYVDVYVSYTPRDNGTDVEKMIIACNDPDPEDARFEVPIRGGAVPSILLQPSSVLSFFEGAPVPRREQVTIYNVGFGELVISRLKITGPADAAHPDGQDDHPSVDDFSIIDPAGCGVLCDPDIHLCPPGPGCTMSSKVVVIEYANNDISTTDYVELQVFSNDPSQPKATVVLRAEDTPCFPPTGTITVTTPRPCAGQPVQVNANSSDPGGPVGMPSTIVSYHWEWLFAQPPPPTFSPNDGPTTLTNFTPTRGGVYFLGLRVTNACGSESPALASEMINVSDVCN